MIVSLGIFTIVALISIGALVRITDANKKSITLKTTINNLNFALESLSREMRVGGEYHCTSGSGQSITNPGLLNENFHQSVANSCPNGLTGNWTISFKSTKKSGAYPNDCNLIYSYSYYKDEGTIKKAEQSTCGGSVSEFNDLISRDIIITDTIVNVNVADQPKAFFWFKGYSGVREKERTSFEVQTSVSQRIGAE